VIPPPPNLLPLSSHNQLSNWLIPRVGVICKPGVRPNKPFVPHPPIFEKNRSFRDFLLSKSTTTRPPPAFTSVVLHFACSDKCRGRGDAIEGILARTEANPHVADQYHRCQVQTHIVVRKEKITRGTSWWQFAAARINFFFVKKTLKTHFHTSQGHRVSNVVSISSSYPRFSLRNLSTSGECQPRT
jgi:hypothetical protein